MKKQKTNQQSRSKIELFEEVSAQVFRMISLTTVLLAGSYASNQPGSDTTFALPRPWAAAAGLSPAAQKHGSAAGRRTSRVGGSLVRMGLLQGCLHFSFTLDDAKRGASPGRPTSALTSCRWLAIGGGCMRSANCGMAFVVPCSCIGVWVCRW